jgi:hypothetical protein
LRKEVFITGAKYSPRQEVPTGIYAPVRNPVIKNPIIVFSITALLSVMTHLMPRAACTAMKAAIGKRGTTETRKLREKREQG